MNDSRGALKNVIIPGVTETRYANDTGGLFPGTKLGSQHGRLLQGNQMSSSPQDLLSPESSGACSPEQIQEPEAPQVGSQGPTSRAMVFKSDPWAISTRVTWNMAEMKLTGPFQEFLPPTEFWGWFQPSMLSQALQGMLSAYEPLVES